MKLEVVKSENGWKIISYSNNKHPALIEIGRLLKDNNKYSTVKIGVYSVSIKPFSLIAKVFSYSSGKSEDMHERNYRKWLKGKRQIYVPKTKEEKEEKKWLDKQEELDINKLFDEVTNA